MATNISTITRCLTPLKPTLLGTLRSWIVCCLLAIFCTTAMIVFRFALEDLLNQHVPLYLSLIVAVFAAAAYGGLKTGLLTTALCILLGSWMYPSPPEQSLVSNNQMRVMVFLIEGLAISCSFEAMHRAHERIQEKRARLAATVKALEVEICERQRAETTLRESEGKLRVALSKLKVSIKEKEVLLREVHHRVKNNLQIIQSLLSIQGTKIQDSAGRALYKECQHRVRAIALVHDKLYKSPNLASFDLASYLSDLVLNLVRSYCTGSGVITPTIVVETATLGIDQLIPCALIVNELVCNALKYGFPDGRSGEVRVEVRRRDDQVSLTVADNGVGLSVSDMRRASGIGLQVVGALVDQLSGKLAWANGSGTSATITFPEKI